MKNPIRVIRMNVDALHSIDIGRANEQNATIIEINIARWLSIWPDGVATLWFMRPDESTRYPAVTNTDGNILRWPVSDFDTEIPGTGKMEISFLRGEDQAISTAAVVTISPRIAHKSGDHGDAEPDWSKNVIQKTAENAKRAEDSADRAQKIVDEFEPGAGGSMGAGLLRYDRPQELTDAEKAQARENLGIEIYQGTYTVTPHTKNSYTLETSQKLMDGDIHIQKIPYAEVSNTSGGTTVTIGELEE